MAIRRKWLMILWLCGLCMGTVHAQNASLKEQTFNVKGVSFTMVAVQGGTFTMGGTYEQVGDIYEDEEPTH
ncbi:MAG: hypothetical protein J6S82_02255, partial [Bacteroidales bacterium]|nr:hypothetical protein [Bacteroidales bacterium]